MEKVRKREKEREREKQQFDFLTSHKKMQTFNCNVSNLSAFIHCLSCFHLKRKSFTSFADEVKNYSFKTEARKKKTIEQ